MRARSASAVVVIAGVIVAGAVSASSLFGQLGRDRGDAASSAHAVERLSDLFTTEGGPVVPGEPPRGVSGTAPSDCAECHAEIAAEWARSAHARSWTDPIFQAEYHLSQQAFCRHCHAPLAREASIREPAAPGRRGARLVGSGSEAAPVGAGESLAARGIDCAVCHVRDGHVHGPQGRGGDEHAARRDARLATSAFCGGCHQFNFPAPAPGERVRYHPGQPLQNTIVEWSQSRYADRPCQHCHMPMAGEAGDRHRSHAFRTLDDPELMARAVRVTADARRHGGTIGVTVVISPGEIGHAFPTGDMFRRAVMTVGTAAVRRHEVLMRYFAQTITEDGSGHLLGQVDDTRVLPAGAGPPLRLDFELDDPGATEVWWSLELFRLAPEDALDRGLDDAATGLRFLSGRIAVQAP